MISFVYSLKIVLPDFVLPFRLMVQWKNLCFPFLQKKSFLTDLHLLRKKLSFLIYYHNVDSKWNLGDF